MRLAQRLRREMTMSLKRTVEHLRMGSLTYVSNLLGVRGLMGESVKSEAPFMEEGGF